VIYNFLTRVQNVNAYLYIVIFLCYLLYMLILLTVSRKYL